MFAYLRKPHVDLGTLLLRLGLAAVFMAHGYIKVYQPLSWTTLISPAWQQIVGWTELVCGTALALGLLSRLAALGPMAVMIGAIALVTGAHEFIFVDVGPSGFTFKASGYEYNFMIIVVCLAVIVMGSGRYSLDRLIFGRKKTPLNPAQPVGGPHVASPAVHQTVP